MTAADRIRSVAERHELAWIAIDRLLGALIFLGTAVALAALVVAVTSCGPTSGSPNCPQGQLYVDVPGSGWTCASNPDPGSVFTPAPAGSAP